MPFRKSKVWGLQKPPPGTPINFGHPLARGLIGAWALNESAGLTTLDGSGKNQTGTFTSSPTWNPAKTGIGVKGAGAGYIALPGNLFTSSVLSVSLWVQFTSITATTYYGIFSVETANGDGMEMFIDAAQTLGLYFGAFGSSVKSGNNTISVGPWFHLLGTCDGTNQRLYINGIAAGSPVAPAFTTFSAAGALLARTGGSFAVNAIMDQAMIYNRALSAAEALQMYQSPWSMYATPKRRIISGASPAAGGSVVNLSGLFVHS